MPNNFQGLVVLVVISLAFVLHSCTAAEECHTYAWGKNSQNEAGLDLYFKASPPISANHIPDVEKYRNGYFLINGTLYKQAGRELKSMGINDTIVDFDVSVDTNVNLGCALTASRDTLYCWGASTNFLFFGSNLPTTVTTPVSYTFTNKVIKQISVGLAIHILLSNNTILGWGDCSQYSAGTCTTTTDVVNPAQINMPSGYTWKKIVNGGAAVYVLSTTYELFAWGGANQGQQGVPVYAAVKTPTKFPLPASVADVAAHSGVVFVLMRNGTIFASGTNTNSQTNLVNGKTVSDTPYMIPLPGPAAAVFATPTTAFAVLTNGKLYGWGDNDYFQLSGPTSVNFVGITEIVLPNITTVFGNEKQIFYVSSDGNKYISGDNSGGEFMLSYVPGTDLLSPTRMAPRIDNNNITQILASQQYAYLNTSQGYIGFGFNSNGVLTTTGNKVGYKLVNMTAIQGIPIRTLSLSPSNVFALTEQGALYAIGSDVLSSIWTPVNLTNVSGKLMGVCGGSGHAAAFDSNNKIYTWGKNNNYGLGSGEATSAVRKIPTSINSTILQGRTIKQISCTTYHTLILTSDNQIFAFGLNTYGSLGINSTATVSTMVQVVGANYQGKTFSKVHAGYGYSFALTTAGELFAWGGEVAFKISNLPILHPEISALLAGTNIIIVDVTSSSTVTIAKLSNGSLAISGKNTNGHLGIGPGSSTLMSTLILPIPDGLEYVKLVASSGDTIYSQFCRNTSAAASSISQPKTSIIQQSSPMKSSSPLLPTLSPKASLGASPFPSQRLIASPKVQVSPRASTAKPTPSPSPKYSYVASPKTRDSPQVSRATPTPTPVVNYSPKVSVKSSPARAVGISPRPSPKPSIRSSPIVSQKLTSSPTVQSSPRRSVLSPAHSPIISPKVSVTTPAARSPSVSSGALPLASQRREVSPNPLDSVTQAAASQHSSTSIGSQQLPTPSVSKHLPTPSASQQLSTPAASSSHVQQGHIAVEDDSFEKWINPNLPLTLKPKVTLSREVGVTSYQWTSSDLTLSSSTLASSTVVSTLIFRGGAMTRLGSVYQVTITVTNSVLGSKSAVYTIRTAQYPFGGSCIASPTIGIALSTKFIVNCTGWSSGVGNNAATSFKFAVQNGDVNTDLSSSLLSSVETQLPSGSSVAVVVSISNAVGLSVIERVPITVTSNQNPSALETTVDTALAENDVSKTASAVSVVAAEILNTASAITPTVASKVLEASEKLANSTIATPETCSAAINALTSVVKKSDTSLINEQTTSKSVTIINSVSTKCILDESSSTRSIDTISKLSDMKQQAAIEAFSTTVSNVLESHARSLETGESSTISGQSISAALSSTTPLLLSDSMSLSIPSGANVTLSKSSVASLSDNDAFTQIAYLHHIQSDDNQASEGVLHVMLVTTSGASAGTPTDVVFEIQGDYSAPTAESNVTLSCQRLDNGQWTSSGCSLLSDSATSAKCHCEQGYQFRISKSSTPIPVINPQPTITTNSSLAPGWIALIVIAAIVLLLLLLLLILIALIVCVCSLRKKIMQKSPKDKKEDKDVEMQKVDFSSV